MSLNRCWPSNLCVNSISLKKSEILNDDVATANASGAKQSVLSTVYPPAEPPVIAIRCGSMSEYGSAASCCTVITESRTSAMP